VPAIVDMDPRDILVLPVAKAVAVPWRNGGGVTRELLAWPDSKDWALRVSVADTGSGIAPEVVSQLFQPFITTKQQGMGVGLSICRTIVESHGGQIWAEPNPGGGTIFHFTLRGVRKDEVGNAV